MESVGRFSSSITAFVLLLVLIAALGFSLPSQAYALVDSRTGLAIGVIGIWRYGWGVLHFIRSNIYRGFVYPRMKRRALAHDAPNRPCYLLVTSYRIPPEVTERVYRAAILAALDAPGRATVIASIVDLADQRLIKSLFASLVDDTSKVDLVIVRIAGTGKRDALAHGFRAIARLLPPADFMVAVIDGDSIVPHNLVKACAPFFHDPKVGALTTDEHAEVRGSALFQQWYSLRFAQRHILMSSMGLSRKVLTLTGRMSMFRASIICNPDFIAQVETDSIDHPRFGRFSFLTGDDKSSWFWLLKNHYQMLYIPDISIATVEDPPSDRFIPSAAALMTRWYGNMLRTNGRALALGPRRLGPFVWWAILDQRLSMWTCLVGLTTALLATFFISPLTILVYVVWVLATRTAQSILLLSARRQISVFYPFLLYFNQIFGSFIKTYIFFRLNRQKWTRQKTSLAAGSNRSAIRINDTESLIYHGTALLALAAVCSWFIGLTSRLPF